MMRTPKGGLRQLDPIQLSNDRLVGVEPKPAKYKIGDQVEHKFAGRGHVVDPRPYFGCELVRVHFYDTARLYNAGFRGNEVCVWESLL